MSRITSTCSLLLAVIVVSGCQAAVSEPAEIETVSIQEARGMSMGEPVRVSGTVTVQSGAFASSNSSGFAVQDESAGIYVLDSDHAFKLGDKVKVTGKRGAEFGQLNIILESAEKLTGSDSVNPEPVKTGNAPGRRSVKNYTWRKKVADWRYQRRRPCPLVVPKGIRRRKWPF